MAVLDTYYSSSDKISDTVRNVAYALIGACFGILALEVEAFSSLVSELRNLIISIMIFSVVSVFLDYIHSVFKFLNARYKYKKGKSEDDKGIGFYFHVGHTFFYLKQGSILIAFILFIVLMTHI